MSVLVIAAHPDDETLGCGGVLLRHADEGAAVYWLIVTGLHSDHGFDAERISSREREIEAVARHYGFAGVFRLDQPTTRLDVVPRADLVRGIGAVVGEVEPATVYLPHRGDAHSDHAVVFDAAAACTKWFRYPSVRRVRAYETLSETDFGLGSEGAGFQPSLYVDISNYVDRKVEAMRLYEGEMGDHPFPRSEKAIRALATLRGAASGCVAAEAFVALREIQ